MYASTKFLQQLKWVQKPHWWQALPQKSTVNSVEHKCQHLLTAVSAP